MEKWRIRIEAERIGLDNKPIGPAVAVLFFVDRPTYVECTKLNPQDLLLELLKIANLSGIFPRQEGGGNCAG